VEGQEGQERRAVQARPVSIWGSVDKWGPGAVAIVTFIALIYYAWMSDQRIARLEGMVEARLKMEASLRMEIQTTQAYVNSLRVTMTAHGIVAPEMPE
jgi:hypothetical protein